MVIPDRRRQRLARQRLFAAALARIVGNDDPSLHVFECCQPPVDRRDQHEGKCNPRKRDHLGPSDARDPHVLAGVVDLLDALIVNIGDDSAPD